MEFKAYRKMCLVPREKAEQVDWDGLVNEVFKEEVDHFLLESGMEALKIDQGVNSCYKRLISTSISLRYTSSSSTL